MGIGTLHSVTVRMDDPLHRAFKAHCALRGTDMAAYLRTAARSLTHEPFTLGTKSSVATAPRSVRTVQQGV